MQRRNFLQTTTKATLGLSLLGLTQYCSSPTEPGTSGLAQNQVDSTATLTPATDTWFDISLAQWSLNKALFGGELDNLDFAKKARQEFGLGGIEYVNQFFKDKAEDMGYLKQLKARADDQGVKSLLIMIDREGNLGDQDRAARLDAVKAHYKWVDAAAFLGCHSIRVNAAGQGSREEVAKAATEGLSMLSEYAARTGLNVIVENHGGWSSDGQWLAGVMQAVDMENCGTLPDFGNFCVERNDPEDYGKGCKTEYDRYQGVEDLMPYAKAVSAKAYDFDETGEVVETKYSRMMDIVKNHGYRGWVGIEYEGDGLDPDVGIQRTIDVLRAYGGRVVEL